MLLQMQTAQLPWVPYIHTLTQMHSAVSNTPENVMDDAGRHNTFCPGNCGAWISKHAAEPAAG